MRDENTILKDWIKQRALSVKSRYNAFDCLCENGHSDKLVNENVSVSIFCPFHPNTNTPAARYYSVNTGKHDFLKCYVCKESWDCINLHAKFKGVRYMEALSNLEKRFGIKVSKRPEPPPIADPLNREDGYVSDKWSDPISVVKIIEKKLERIKNSADLKTYVKVCRVLDHVAYDYGLSKETSQEMMDVLKKAMNICDEEIIKQVECDNQHLFTDT